MTDLQSHSGEKVIEDDGERVAVVAFKVAVKPDFGSDEHGKSECG